MAGGEHHREMGEAAALGRLLDPVALEARLAEARSRRAAALAAKAPPPAGPAPDLPAPDRPAPSHPASEDPAPLVDLGPLAVRGAAVILAGLAGLAALVTAGSLLLARPAQAPVVALTAALLSEPGAVPSPPRPGLAGRLETPPPPMLAGLAFAAPAPSPLRPRSRPAAEPVVAAAPQVTAMTRVAPSKARAVRPSDFDAPALLTRATPAAILPSIGRSPDLVTYPVASDDRARTATPSRARAARVTDYENVAPVLRRAAVAAILPIISRSPDLRAYPVGRDDRARPTRGAAPKAVRRSDGLVRQVTRAGREAVRGVTRGDPGGLARAVHRVSAALQQGARSGGWNSRHDSDRSERRATRSGSRADGLAPNRSNYSSDRGNYSSDRGSYSSDRGSSSNGKHDGYGRGGKDRDAKDRGGKDRGGKDRGGGRDRGGKDKGGKGKGGKGGRR